jgi:hypothetical protein
MADNVRALEPEEGSTYEAAMDVPNVRALEPEEGSTYEAAMDAGRAHYLRHDSKGHPAIVPLRNPNPPNKHNRMRTGFPHDGEWIRNGQMRTLLVSLLLSGFVGFGMMTDYLHSDGYTLGYDTRHLNSTIFVAHLLLIPFWRVTMEYTMEFQFVCEFIQQSAMRGRWKEVITTVTETFTEVWLQRYPGYAAATSMQAALAAKIAEVTELTERLAASDATTRDHGFKIDVLDGQLKRKRIAQGHLRDALSDSTKEWRTRTANAEYEVKQANALHDAACRVLAKARHDLDRERKEAEHNRKTASDASIAASHERTSHARGHRRAQPQDREHGKKDRRAPRRHRGAHRYQHGARRGRDQGARCSRPHPDPRRPPRAGIDDGLQLVLADHRHRVGPPRRPSPS